jgi:hypothetical protein
MRPFDPGMPSEIGAVAPFGLFDADDEGRCARLDAVELFRTRELVGRAAVTTNGAGEARPMVLGSKLGRIGEEVIAGDNAVVRPFLLFVVRHVVQRHYN